MKGAIILSLVVAQAAGGSAAIAPAPSPEASPLKVIIDVKARTLCTALHDNVAVSLAGLITNDRIIDTGRKAILKMGADQVKGSIAHPMDALVAENVVGSMVHNLAIIDQKLDDPARFPLDPKTDDERLADRVKAQLLAIADTQRRQLNALNGTIETDNLNTMQHDVVQPTVMDKAGATLTPPPDTNISNAGLKDAPNTPARTDPRTLAAGNLIGTTYYGSLADAMSGQQQSTQELESTAAATIRQAAAQCAAEAPQPSP